MPDMGSGSAAEAAASVRAGHGFVQLLADACVTIQRPGTPCFHCAAACPTDAISVSERTLEISQELCTGCGRCATVCPTGALAVDGFAIASSCARIRIECSRVPVAERDSSDAVVPCLGGLTASQVRAWLATGIDEIILVDRGWCAACPTGGTDAPWGDVLAKVGCELDLLDARSNRSIRVDTRPLPNQAALSPAVARGGASETLTRRQLFARLSDPKPKSSATRASACNQPPSTVRADALNERRRQLAQLLADSLPAALFPAVSIAETCCDNRICAHACPTAALRAIQETGFGGIEFDAALCIACRACEEACPTHSISLSTAGSNVYPGAVLLQRRAHQICAQCGDEFAMHDGRSVCLACCKDADIVRLSHDLMRRRAMPSPRESENPGISSRSKVGWVHDTCEQEGAR